MARPLAIAVTSKPESRILVIAWESLGPLGFELVVKGNHLKRKAAARSPEEYKQGLHRFGG